jgi:hypothetical protein
MVGGTVLIEPAPGANFLCLDIRFRNRPCQGVLSHFHAPRELAGLGVGRDRYWMIISAGAYSPGVTSAPPAVLTVYTPTLSIAQQGANVVLC